MPEAKDDLKREKVRIVEISKIKDFPDHPFLVKDDESMAQLVNSIRMNGVLNPVIARKVDEEHYELISGHRRKHACILLGIDRIPLIGREMTKEEAVNINTVGSISGEGSEAALMSYLGYTAMGSGATDVPKFSNVEIGGGRMMATETSAEHPDGIDVGMYHTDQYMKPTGDFTTITAADGTSWYKQYAQDTVKRTPYTAPNGQVAYREEVVKELPHPPQRKDKV